MARSSVPVTPETVVEVMVESTVDFSRRLLACSRPEMAPFAAPAHSFARHARTTT